jgi:hypothetical protein
MTRIHQTLGRLCGALCACALASCVEARGVESEGQASFVSGARSTSSDYQAFSGAGSAGGAGGAAGATQPAGAGGMVAPLTGGTGGMAVSPTSGGAGGAGGTLATGGASGAASGGSGGAMASGGVSGSAGEGGEAGGGSGGGGGGSATAGSLMLEFMSAGNAGEYAPRNVGAVWVETSSGQFVKTLSRWAGIRAGHLTQWTGASGGWGGGFFFATGGGSADELDAITAATLRTHQMHSIPWDMQDPAGMVVPDGSYVIKIEVTESERKASIVASIDFEKGAAPVSLSPPDSGPYSNLHLTYTP